MLNEKTAHRQHNVKLTRRTQDAPSFYPPCGYTRTMATWFNTHRLFVATLLVATWGAIGSSQITGDWFHAPAPARIYLVTVPFISLGVILGRV